VLKNISFKGYFGDNSLRNERTPYVESQTKSLATRRQYVKVRSHQEINI